MLFAPGCRVKGMCSLLEGWGCPFCDGKTREGGGWGAGEEGAEDRGVKDDAGAGDGVSEGWLGTGWTIRALIKTSCGGVMGWVAAGVDSVEVCRHSLLQRNWVPSWSSLRLSCLRKGQVWLFRCSGQNPGDFLAASLSPTLHVHLSGESILCACGICPASDHFPPAPSLLGGRRYTYPAMAPSASYLDTCFCPHYPPPHPQFRSREQPE